MKFLRIVVAYMEINRKMFGFHPETRYLNGGKYVCIFGVVYLDLYKYF